MKRKSTYATIFMLPTLKLPLLKLKEAGLLNCYLDDKMSDIKYEDCIYILFKPDNIDLFKDFLDSEYERTKQIIEDYDYEGGFVVVVYRLMKCFKKDYKLIKKGKYSKTSKNFQKSFPKVIKLMKNGLHRDELSLQYRIFNKTNDLIEYWQDKLGITYWEEDMEVWPEFKIENETLNKKVLNENRKIVEAKS